MQMISCHMHRSVAMLCYIVTTRARASNPNEFLRKIAKEKKCLLADLSKDMQEGLNHHCCHRDLRSSYLARS
jgi:hypothetical protein